jgi:hypothetical protein
VQPCPCPCPQEGILAAEAAGGRVLSGALAAKRRPPTAPPLSPGAPCAPPTAAAPAPAPAGVAGRETCQPARYALLPSTPLPRAPAGRKLSLCTWRAPRSASAIVAQQLRRTMPAQPLPGTNLGRDLVRNEGDPTPPPHHLTTGGREGFPDDAPARAGPPRTCAQLLPVPCHSASGESVLGLEAQGPQATGDPAMMGAMMDLLRSIHQQLSAYIASQTQWQSQMEQRMARLEGALQSLSRSESAAPLGEPEHVHYVGEGTSARG